MELQNLRRLAPCPMCIFQRVLYLVIGGLALLGFLLPVARLAWAGLIGLLALLGVGVAAYQTWMQAFPTLATECGYAEPNLMERLVDWLGMQWPSMFLATGFCASRDWSFWVCRWPTGPADLHGALAMRRCSSAQELRRRRKNKPPKGGFVESGGG